MFGPAPALNALKSVKGSSRLSAVRTVAAAQFGLVHRLPQRRAFGQQNGRTGPSRAAHSAPARCMSSANADVDTAELIHQKNSENPVVIYSKSYCPFSTEIKQLFKKLSVEYKAFELDEIVEGDDVLDSLMDKTASRTVPQVFIKGEYIGGCDDTLKKYKSGKLKELFESAGVSANF